MICPSLRASLMAVAIALPVSVSAQTLTFDDLLTRDSFSTLGIGGTYAGFHWGASLYGTQSSLGVGWASATVASPADTPAPTPVSGSSYAWNFSGPQSLFIDFLGPRNVQGASFATLSSAFGSNANTIQMFAYDGLGNLLASSSVLALTNSFQYLAANFTNIQALEIRANADQAWYSIDDIVVGEAVAAPEPSTFGLMASGLFGVFARVRRRRIRKDIGGL